MLFLSQSLPLHVKQFQIKYICHKLTLSALHVTIVSSSHLVKKVPSQELFSAQSVV